MEIVVVLAVTRVGRQHVPDVVSNNGWSNGSGTFPFDNNLWFRVEGGLRFQWASAVITTFAGWQAKGFER